MNDLFSVEELRFAQKYSFSSLAKRIVKEQDFSLDQIPESVVLRARLIVLKALQNKRYKPQIFASTTLLRDEVLAFPLAKIFISLMNNEDFTVRFSRMVAKNVFSSLEKEKREVIFEIARELKLKFSFGESEESFVQVPLTSFLGVDSGAFFKLVNQRVEKGKVFLSKNEFNRFISFMVEKGLQDSLPLDVGGVPKNLKTIAKEISASAFESKKFQLKDVSFGKVKPEFFPPCIEKLYTEILGGKNLNHLERFTLATFMLSIGMPVDSVINLYSYTPNFNKKLTSYQVTRLAGRGGTKYSAAGCSKMAEYKLRLPECPCTTNRRIRHPVQFYKGQVFKVKKPSA